MSSLSQAERLCLELAWEAFGAGSVPVGAVVLDAADGVVATGRSRMYENSAPPPELANSLLAHAEVNALVGLDPRRRYENHTLVSALEPGDTTHTARVPLQVHGPRDDSVGILVSALHLACYLQRNPEGAVVRVHRQRQADLVRVAERLVAAGAAEQAHSGASLDQVASDLLGMCEA